MKRPAIFFDRDNTIIVSDGYLGDPEKVELMDGAADAIARARSLGFATVIVSNQSGVARGMFTENDVHAVNRRVDQLLLAANSAAVIDRHEFCPFHPDGTLEQYKLESHLRKPKPGMILEAAEKLALDLGRSWLVGDAPRDIEAGKAAGCRTILLIPADVAASPATAEKLKSRPDCVVSSLKQALDFVEQSLVSPADAPPAPVAAPAPAPVDAPAAAPALGTAHLERIAEQILVELRRRSEHAEYADFSVSKLMAGIVQVIALATIFLSYLNRNDANFIPMIDFATFLEVLTIALLIMGKQK